MHLDDVPVVGAIAAAASALGGGLVKLIGSRRERAESEAIEAGPAERAAAIALTMVERANEDTQRHRIERDDYAARLDAMGERVWALEAAHIALQRAHDEVAAAHALCPSRIALLESEQRVARQMLADLMRGNQSTPPRGIHPDELQAAMAAKETRP